MIEVRLHGSLSRFEGPFRFKGKTLMDAMRAMFAQVKGFKDAFRVGEFVALKNGEQIGYDEFLMETGKGCVVDLTPVPQGCKNSGGTAKTIIGALIVIAAVATATINAPAGASLGAAMAAEAFTVAGFSVSYMAIAGFGALMLLGGLSSLLAGSVKSGTAKDASNDASSVFNGNVNLSKQGLCQPLLYGTFHINPYVISSDLSVVRVPV